MSTPAKSPRQTLAQRLERSRRHRQWLGKDSSSVGGGSVSGGSVVPVVTTVSEPVTKVNLHSAQCNRTSEETVSIDPSASFKTGQSRNRATMANPEKRDTLVSRRQRALQIGRKRAANGNGSSAASQPRLSPSASKEVLQEASPSSFAVQDKTVNESDSKNNTPNRAQSEILPGHEKTSRPPFKHLKSPLERCKTPVVETSLPEYTNKIDTVVTPKNGYSATKKAPIQHENELQETAGNREELPKAHTMTSQVGTNSASWIKEMTRPALAREERAPASTEKIVPSWKNRNSNVVEQLGQGKSWRSRSTPDVKLHVSKPALNKSQRGISQSVKKPGSAREPENFTSAYGATIETPKVASVASLRASFNARGSNRPIMPMNSSDPRVRQTLPPSTTPSKNGGALDSKPRKSWQKEPVNLVADDQSRPSWTKRRMQGVATSPKAGKSASESLNEEAKFSLRNSVSPTQVREGYFGPKKELLLVKEPPATKLQSELRAVVVSPVDFDPSASNRMHALQKESTRHGVSRPHQKRFSKAPWQQDSAANKRTNENEAAGSWRKTRHSVSSSTHDGSPRIQLALSVSDNAEEVETTLGPFILPQKSKTPSISSKTNPTNEVLGPVTLPTLPKEEKKTNKENSEERDSTIDFEQTSELEAATKKDDRKIEAAAQVAEQLRKDSGCQDMGFVQLSLPSGMISLNDHDEEKKNDDTLILDEETAHALYGATVVSNKNHGGENSATTNDQALPVQTKRDQVDDCFEDVTRNISMPASSSEDNDSYFYEEVKRQSANSLVAPSKSDVSADAFTREAPMQAHSLRSDKNRDSSPLRITIKQSDSTSVYIEDDTDVESKMETAYSAEKALLPLSTEDQVHCDNKIRIELPNDQFFGKANENHMTHDANTRYPRLTPSPRDSDAYRQGYFGDSPTSQRPKSRNHSTPTNAIERTGGKHIRESIAFGKDSLEDETRRQQTRTSEYLESPGYDESSRDTSSRGMSSTLQGSYPDELLDSAGVFPELPHDLETDVEAEYISSGYKPSSRDEGAPCETNVVFPSRVPSSLDAKKEDVSALQLWVSHSGSESEVDKFEADLWLDKDPDLEGFGDGDSLSGHQEKRSSLFVPISQADNRTNDRLQVNTQQINKQSGIGKQDTYKMPKKNTQEDVFDPFAQDDDLRIENSENLFSPSQDAFLTEESFSPLDWGSPREKQFFSDETANSKRGFEI